MIPGAFYICFYLPRYIKVTTCALVQVSSGENVVSVVPLVTPFTTAQRTGL